MSRVKRISVELVRHVADVGLQCEFFKGVLSHQICRHKAWRSPAWVTVRCLLAAEVQTTTNAKLRCDLVSRPNGAAMLRCER